MKYQIVCNGTKLSASVQQNVIDEISKIEKLLFKSEDFECIRVLTNGLTAIVFNKICENTELIDDFVTDIENYTIGDYECPEAIICSSIMPGNLFHYNKILDKPLLVQNSREFYYEKCINEILETDMFSKYELYQTLLILGDQKKVLNVEKHQNIKIYTDPISNKKYTKKSN